LDGPKSRQKEVMKMETSGICVWFILVDFLLVSTSARRKSEEKNSWKNLSQERRYASFTKVGPPAFFGLRSSSQFQHKRRDPKRSINKYYIYINIYIYVCMYMYIHQFQLVGVNNHPETPNFPKGSNCWGVPKRIFMPTAWTTDGLSFFWHFFAIEKHGKPLLFFNCKCTIG
jgi:hypothetical protein